MTIRCKKCHAAVWVQPIHTDSDTASVTCGQCGHKYVLQAWSKLQGLKTPLSARAHHLAKRHEIDLPGAYSALLGIMTVDELREMGDAKSTPCRTAPTGGDKRHHYDRAFQPAIDAGFLTARQAAERGNRDTCAAILASRHGLPHAVALDVADNRKSLLEAMRARVGRGGRGVTSVVVHGHHHARTGMLVALLAIMVCFAYVLRDTGTVAPVGAGKTRAVGAAEVRFDGAGRIVQVNGPNPHSVLRAFCVEGTRRGRLEPLRTVPSKHVAGARARVGLLRDPRRPSQLKSVDIREDREAGLWTAGDGSRPLVAKPAPPAAELAVQGNQRGIRGPDSPSSLD